jgi:hypothetical protein
MRIDGTTSPAETYSGTLGKASMTGYRIRFGALHDVAVAGREAAIRDGITRRRA